MDPLGVIQRLGSGKLIEQMHAAIAEVATMVVMLDKPGSVTVTFRIAKVGEMEAVTISEQIKRGLPVAAARGALFYAVGDGELHQDDPRQIPLNFRVVEDEVTGARRFEEDEPEMRTGD